MLGGNKWESKSVSINSLTIKNDNEGYFNYKIFCYSKLDERGIIFELSTPDHEVVGDPIIFNNTFITQTSNVEATEKDQMFVAKYFNR